MQIVQIFLIVLFAPTVATDGSARMRGRRRARESDRFRDTLRRFYAFAAAALKAFLGTLLVAAALAALLLVVM